MQVISIPSSTSYSDLQTLTGYPVGTAMLLTNNTSQALYVVQSATQPDVTSAQYPVQVGQTVILESSTVMYWIKGSTGPVVVQLNTANIAPYSIVDLPDDVWTAGGVGNRRLQVDDEQASFQDNTQFRVFDRIVEVSPNDQIVYYFQTTNPLFIILRKLDLYSGGREYLVYGTGDFSFTGSLGAPLPIREVNGHLKVGTLVHPTSGVTVQRAVGTNIFIPNTSTPSNGTLVVTNGTGNRSSSVYAPNAIKSGVAAGQSFYLVLNHIGQANNNNSSGQFNLSWEEIF